MAFTYCPKCGFKNLYSIKPPNFCGGCGEQMSSASSVATKTKAPGKPLGKTVRKRAELEEGGDEFALDGTDIYSVPDIQSLAYEIEHEKISFDLKDVLPEPDIEEKPTKRKAKKRGRPKKK
tara:strand:- start:49 stop:411 length:363 start_codon:yes stop_codon:yes gene_type:complete